jgi:PBP1b-binding outer membrane lipoprotein LpoB
MLPLIFTKKKLLSFTLVTVLLFGCSDSMGDNTSIKTSGTQPTTPNNIEAVDGSIVSVSEFNGVPTAMWFWSPN